MVVGAPVIRLFRKTAVGHSATGIHRTSSAAFFWSWAAAAIRRAGSYSARALVTRSS